MSAVAYFQWDDKLALNVNKMDEEHKVLIGLMNDLHLLKMNTAAHSQIQVKLSELNQFTLLHFNHEEEYFSSFPYNKAEAHRNIHKELISRLKEFTQKFELEKKLSDDFFLFLKVWLTAHIMGIDAGYAQVKPQSI